MEYYMKKQIGIVAYLYIGELCVGFLTWSSPVIPKLQDPAQNVLPDVITNSQASWVGAGYLPGALLGALLAGWFSNIIGRKRCLNVAGILNMLSYFVLATAHAYWMIILGRFLNGVSVGAIYILNYTYITEISSTDIRGVLVTATGIFTSSGVLFVYVIGPYCSYVEIMYAGFFLAMAYTLGSLVIPESPVFEILIGKEMEAKKTLVYLGRSDDFEEVLSSQPPEAITVKQGLKDLFCVPTNRKALMISLILFICQGMSGYITVVTFSTSIFQSANSSIDPGVSTIIVGVTQVLSSCVTPLFIEKKGRKILLIVSTAGCSTSMALLGFYFTFHNTTDSSPNQFHWVPLLSLITFLISYQSGYFTVPGATSSEMFDSSARGPGSSLTFFVGTVICTIVTPGFAYISASVGSHVTFFLFAASSGFACLFTSVFLIETKGKSLAEVQLLLGSRLKSNRNTIYTSIRN